ncbi:MAG: polyprenyl synthetase family protein [Clostridiales bacterium]|nr:polyprenyl synthetase family protein [Clostridiales bacterium]MDD7594225.1 polyprenyl synthetase family protein [Clostridiales bacterium]
MSNGTVNINIEAALCASAEKVASALRRCYPADAEKDTLYNAELYSLMAGGKRIRPFLTLEFCRLFGGSEEAAMPFACAVEMMHTFSLIHDDLPCMDNDDLRRGRPTSHKMFGEATALLAGDSLELRAVKTALLNAQVSPLDSRRAATVLADCAGKMIEGQVMDMAAEREAISMEQLLTLQSKKTGALMEVSAAMGCIAAGIEDDAPEMNDAVLYAGRIGLAFQIIDDILDAQSTAEELGKSVGSDARDGKTTFLSFMSADEARSYARRVTDAAIDAVAGYHGSETLVTLAEWLLTRRK